MGDKIEGRVRESADGLRGRPQTPPTKAARQEQLREDKEGKHEQEERLTYDPDGD